MSVIALSVRCQIYALVYSLSTVNFTYILGFIMVNFVLALSYTKRCHEVNVRKRLPRKKAAQEDVARAGGIDPLHLPGCSEKSSCGDPSTVRGEMPSTMSGLRASRRNFLKHLLAAPTAASLPSQNSWPNATTAANSQSDREIRQLSLIERISAPVLSALGKRQLKAMMLWRIPSPCGHGVARATAGRSLARAGALCLTQSCSE